MAITCNCRALIKLLIPALRGVQSLRHEKDLGLNVTDTF